MNEEIKVSVYCLCYNHSKYIESALKGFVEQKTNFRYEVIIHDDASQDDSRKIIEAYAEKYPDIIKPIFQEDNQYSKGVEIVKTYIIPRLQGKYVACCEGDDYWINNNKLQKQYDFLENNREYVACVHNCLREDVANDEKRVMYSSENDCDLTFYDMSKGGGFCYQTASLFYRKEYLESRPSFFELVKGFEDYPTAMYLSLSGKVRYFCDVMSVYRANVPGSWSITNTRYKHKKAVSLEKTIRLVNAVDEYTSGEYHEHLKRINVQNEYDYYYYSGNYSMLRKEPYKKIYQKKSASYKLKTYLKQILRQ